MNNPQFLRTILNYLCSEWYLHFGNVDPLNYHLHLDAKLELDKADWIRDPRQLLQQLEAGYDAMAPHAEQISMCVPFQTAYFIAYLTQAIEQGRPQLVIDAGCGIGLPLGWLAMQFPNVQFLGYDLSQKSIDRAAARMQRLGCDNVTFVKGSHDDVVESTGITNGDMIFCKNVHPKIHQIATLSRLIKVGGQLLYLQPMCEGAHQDFVARGRLFGLTEVVAGRSFMPDEFRGTQRRTRHPNDPLSYPLTDTLVLCKQPPPF